MPQQREFHYRFEDLSGVGMLTTDLQPPRGAKIVINIEDAVISTSGRPREVEPR